MTIFDLKYAGKTCDQTGVMCNKDKRYSQHIGYVFYQIDYGMAVFRIKISGRFIAQQDLWFICQSPCDRDTLLLATGKLTRKVTQTI